MVNCPQELKKVYKEGRLLPFIGAGISMSVSWDVKGLKKRGPSWEELVNKAANILGFDDPDLLRVRGTDLQILEYFRLINNTAKLTNWLVQEINPPDDALKDSAIHKKLTELDKCKTFYTTNFDDFLERSFNLLGRNNKVIVQEQHMCRANNDECEIIKFHGDLNHTDMLVLSEADYERRLSLSTELDYRFKSDLLNRTVLFLGYSFRDPNVSYLFRLITEQFKNNNGISSPRAYIVVKHPSEFEKKLFNARHIEILPARTDDLTSFICDLLEKIKN
ncbi:MAG: SIR2 family protein [Nitrospinae bacterium]|nr:SIR2 family protein [Nitrospinota bacterium]